MDSGVGAADSSPEAVSYHPLEGLLGLKSSADLLQQFWPGQGAVLGDRAGQGTPIPTDAAGLQRAQWRKKGEGDGDPPPHAERCGQGFMGLSIPKRKCPGTRAGQSLSS